MDDIKQQLGSPIPTELQCRSAGRAEADNKLAFDRLFGSIIRKTDHIRRIIVVQMPTVDLVNGFVIGNHHTDSTAGEAFGLSGNSNGILNRRFEFRVPLNYCAGRDQPLESSSQRYGRIIGGRRQVDGDRYFERVQTWPMLERKGQFCDRIMPIVAPDI